MVPISIPLPFPRGLARPSILLQYTALELDHALSLSVSTLGTRYHLSPQDLVSMSYSYFGQLVTRHT
jgi:hypothetical protein